MDQAPTPIKKEPDNTIYSEFEMGFMTNIQKIKDKLFFPFVIVLDKVGLTANLVSLISGTVAILALYMTILTSDGIYFITGIWLHLFIDALDGALSRYQPKKSKYGAVIDVAFDQLGILCSVIYCLYFNLTQPINIGVYFILYTLIIINSFIMMFKRSRLDIIFRPRVYIFAALTFDSILFIRLTDIVLLFANILMLVGWIFGILKITSPVKK